MLTNSVVLGPAVSGVRVCGAAGRFSLFRSATSAMGLFSMGQSDREITATDNHTESNGFAGITLVNGNPNDNVSSCRNTETAGTRSSGDGSQMHIGHNQQRTSQPGMMARAESSRFLLEDYINYYLENAGCPRQLGQRDRTPDVTQTTMRTVGDDCAQRPDRGKTVGENLDEMVTSLNLTTETVDKKLPVLMNVMFADKECSWGRLVVLVVFAGKLSAYCMRNSKEQLVDSIIDIVSNFIDTKLGTWIEQNEGWSGFVAFFETPDIQPNYSWTGPLALLSAAAVGVALTLGALYKS